MKIQWKRIAAMLLCILLLCQTADLGVLADAAVPELHEFDDAAIPEEMQSENLFLFGSCNMTVPESSGEQWVMKIIRTGDCTDRAEVTVKFTDVSANYGENYTVRLLRSLSAPQVSADRISVVDFLTENADTQEELTATTEEELLALAEAGGGFDTLDANGNVISTVSFGNSESGTGTALSEADLYGAQSITAEDSDVISDLFPGTELRLSFGKGETEKRIAVTPRYSAAAEGDALTIVSLKNPSEGFAVTEDAFSTYLTITDTDASAPATVSLESAEYDAEGDSVVVTVLRSGMLNETLSVNFCTVSDTAEIGLDFQGIDAELFFPMGITKRSVEIPVRHLSDAPLQFYVKLTCPVGCAVKTGTALVRIAPARMMLMGTSGGDGDLLPGTDVPLTMLGGNGAVANGVYRYTTVGIPSDTWQRALLAIDTPYLYDGLQLTWQADSSWPSISYNKISTNGKDYVLENDVTSWEEKTDTLYFRNPKNASLKIESLTSWFNGITVEISELRLLYRTFRFNLVQAEPLEFLGVDSATAASYTAVQFDNNSYATHVDAVVGDSFTIAAPKSQKEIARLTGLQFLGEDGSVIYELKSSNNTRAITVNVTKELMATLACSKLKYEKSGSGYRGNVTVKPVFAYVDAEVTVKPAGEGSFTGDLAVSGTEKTFQMHLGDRLTLEAVAAESGMDNYMPDGVRYEKRDAAGKLLPDGSGQIDFVAEPKLTYPVDAPRLTLTPVFREKDNEVRVRVKKSEVDGGAFDTSTGIFAVNHGVVSSGDYYVYTVSLSAVHLDQLVTVCAVPTDAGKASVWTLPGSLKTYSGNTFYFTARRTRADNLLTLTTGNALTVSFSGSAYYADRNLSTGNISVNPIIPADGALVCAGAQNTMADGNGDFTLSGVACCASGCVRLLFYCGSEFTLKDVTISPSVSQYALGVVTVSSESTAGAYVSDILCKQNDTYVTGTETLRMNGKALTLIAGVRDGNTYVLNGQTYTETVTGVTFYVLDGTSHAVKSSYEATKTGDGVFTAVINKFAPDSPVAYTYGDVFYVSMTTDRIRGDVTAEDGTTPAAFRSTEYPMLSTGYEIVRDGDYQPQEISIQLPISAATVLAEDPGASGEKRRYASFPLIGSIDSVVGVKGILSDSKFAYYTQGDYTEHHNGGTRTKTQFRVTLTVKQLDNGVNRLMLGMTAVAGNNAWSSSMGYNPLEAYDFKKGEHSTGYGGNKELISDNRSGSKVKDQFTASFGNPRMSFNVSFGIYVDFGIIETTNTNTGETTGLIDSNWEFIGAGGYLGGGVAVEFQWFTVVPVVSIPGYVGVVGTAGVTGYLGATKDSNLVLKYADLEDENGNLSLDDLHFNVDVLANISVKGYLGVGLPDVIGARVIVGADFSFAYSPWLKDYYTQLTNTWGLGVNLVAGGQIDLVVTKIPLEGLSYPAYSNGFTEYFLWLKRANKLVDYTLQEIQSKGANYEDAYISRARTLADRLTADVRDDATLEKLKTDFNTLVKHVYGETKLLTDTEYDLLYLVTPYDIWLNGMNGANYALIEHTDSAWVANRPTLKGSFRQDDTSTLVRDSYSQPSAKIMELDESHLFTVFLTDTSAPGEVTHPTLVWTVYDTDTKQWTEPQIIQNDGTVDYTPSLCDMGTEILVTWASVSKAHGDYASECEMMRDMDVYAARFNKSAGTFSTIDRLTDDTGFSRDRKGDLDGKGYMDCKPVAAYDTKTGSAIVFYLKNDVISTNLTDYVTAESMVCYRLYENGSWTESYYTVEIGDQDASAFAPYAGQRFLPSPLADGKDYPITAISVCEGYNGLAIYAYSVDLDGDLTTNEDTDLFLRIYDFENHKSYKPIRLTEDSVSQGMPQLVRNKVSYTDYYAGEAGETVDGSTYLFWLEDDNQVKYLSVTDLVRHGIDSDGLVQDGYTLRPTTLDTRQSDGSESSVSSYQALTDDKNDLYVLWTQAVDDGDSEDIYTPAALEIFAAAQIHDVAATKYEDGGGVVGSSWSMPVQLTHSGSYNDGLFGTVAGNGKLYLLHNRCSISYIGDTEEYMAEHSLNADGTLDGNPYEIGPTNLMMTTFRPVGSVSASSIRFSDATPKAGDTVTVTATLKNTGLTTAHGYTAVFYECRAAAGGSGAAELTKIAQQTQTEWLPANATETYSFDWTVPEDYDGMTIRCVVTETGYDTQSVTDSAALESRAEYVLTVNSVSQQNDRFVADYTVKNTGNAASAAGDHVAIEFAALYGRYDTVYGLESKELASVALTGLAPEEEKTYQTELNVPMTAFDYCGYDAAELRVEDADDQPLTDVESKLLVLEAPVSPRFTCGERLNLTVGDRRSLTVDPGSAYLAKRMDVVYSTENANVALVDADGNLTAVGQGSTVITAFLRPSGMTVSMNVTVSEPYYDDTPVVTGPTQPTQPTIRFTDVEEDSYCYDAVYWAVGEKVTAGIGDDLFAPEAVCTRAEAMTFLWRAAGKPIPTETECSFTDVTPEDYYYDAVLWAVERGITYGTSETTFSPKDTVTRAQVVTFLARFADAEISTDAQPFRDVAEADYFFVPVIWAAESGITYGTGEDTFSPAEDCTRGQVVTFLYRYVCRRK